MKVLRVVLLVALVAGLALAFQPSVQAQDNLPTWSCEDIVNFSPFWAHSVTIVETGYYEPGPYIFDIGFHTATAATVRITDGTTTLAGPATVPTTLTVDLSNVPQPMSLYIISDTMEPHLMATLWVTVTCGGGCTTRVSLPEQAVVGRFNWNSELYWAPGQQIGPMMYVEAGNTYYIAGQDESEQYYKVLISCDWVWVRKDTVGPNYDEVWHGKPLPTDIVE